MEPLKLATRRWWYIMPIVFITYSLAYLDRANYGFAAASGMAEDLMITPGMSSLRGRCSSSATFSSRCPARSTRKSAALKN